MIFERGGIGTFPSHISFGGIHGRAFTAKYFLVICHRSVLLAKIVR
jgi:hypothetical protein